MYGDGVILTIKNHDSYKVESYENDPKPNKILKVWSNDTKVDVRLVATDEETTRAQPVRHVKQEKSIVLTDEEPPKVVIVPDTSIQLRKRRALGRPRKTALVTTTNEDGHISEDDDEIAAKILLRGIKFHKHNYSRINHGKIIDDTFGSYEGKFELKLLFL